MRHHGRLCKKPLVDGTAAGDVLSWDGDSWEPVDITTLIITDIEIGTAAGQMLFWDGTEWVHTETSELDWDDTAKILVASGLTVTGSSVLGLNSAVFKPAAGGDSTTFFQIKNAAGTQVVGVDTENDRVMIGAGLPNNTFQVAGLINFDDVNQNLFLGTDVFANDEGQYNLGVGYQAGYLNSTIESSSLPPTGTEGTYNLYIGYQAGYGGTSTNQGLYNVFIGRRAGYYNHEGRNNLFIGSASGENNVNGRDNTYIGASAGRIGANGGFNIFIGNETGFNNTGSYNTCIGRYSSFNTTGNENTFIGERTGYTATSAYRNVGIGRYAGYLLTTGDNNVFLGYKSGYYQTTLGSRLIIDNQDRGSAANEITKALIYGVFDADPANQTLRFNARVGINCNPNAPFEVKGSLPGNVGNFPSGLLHVRNADDSEFANSVITGHNSYTTPGDEAGNTQLWYLGSVAGDNNDIAFINRQDAALSLWTNNTEAMRIDSDLLATFAGAITSATLTITASSDTLDVSGVNTVFINISADIILGGLVGGVNGQVVNFAIIGNFTNHVRFEHQEGIGGDTQDFINHTAADEDIDGGGCTYVCNGTNWYDISHAKHV